MEQQQQGQQAPNPGPSAPTHNMLMGILAYLGILVLIPLLVAKDDSFVKFHVKQGLVLLIIEIAAWFVFGHLILFWMLWELVNLGILVLVIVGIVNAVQGKEHELPLIGSLAHYLTF